MARRFEELAWADTDIGPLSLRRRVEPVTGREVHEVKLGEEYLMSSLFTVAETRMATLALEDVPDRDRLRVLVGGLGLGYTAVAALADDRVDEVVVVEALAPVISWHRDELLPQAATLVRDRRTMLVQADFFAVVAGRQPPPPGLTGRFDVVLVDIDHSPRSVLAPSHAPFYTPEGLRRLAHWLVPDGVLALWSDDSPDEAFGAALGAAFARSRAEVVRFANPLTGGESANTVYLAGAVR